MEITTTFRPNVNEFAMQAYPGSEAYHTRSLTQLLFVDSLFRKVINIGKPYKHTGVLDLFAYLYMGIQKNIITH